MGNLCPYCYGQLPMLGVTPGLPGIAGTWWSKAFSQVVEPVLADGPHNPSGELARPTSNLAARSAGR